MPVNNPHKERPRWEVVLQGGRHVIRWTAKDETGEYPVARAYAASLGAAAAKACAEFNAKDRRPWEFR